MKWMKKFLIFFKNKKLLWKCILSKRIKDEFTKEKLQDDDRVKSKNFNH